jgi:15-hydroxyprostaglandin dehydrogenase (NAD)
MSGSGMGKAVVEYLARDGWKVSIADIDEKGGAAVAQAIDGIFNKVDVSKYDSLSAAFQNTWEKYGRLDFGQCTTIKPDIQEEVLLMITCWNATVFANAGVLDPVDFYAEKSLPPPPPSYKATEVNLNGAINSVYLSMHYMRQNPSKGGFVLVTGSGELFQEIRNSLNYKTLEADFLCLAAGIYANAAMPTYGSAKHGVVGLVRGAGRRLSKEGIRVSTILPGPVNTNITSSTAVEIVPGGVNPFGDDVWTSTQNIYDAAMQLYKDPEAGGKVLEVSKGNFYEREQPEWSDELMKKILMATVY